MLTWKNVKIYEYVFLKPKFWVIFLIAISRKFVERLTRKSPI